MRLPAKNKLKKCALELADSVAKKEIVLRKEYDFGRRGGPRSKLIPYCANGHLFSIAGVTPEEWRPIPRKRVVKYFPFYDQIAKANDEEDADKVVSLLREFANA